MADNYFAPLDHRALIRIGGEDRVAFLQGLVSADVSKASEDKLLYGAFLTPQGKFLYDFFLAADGDSLLLEVERAGRDDFRQRLSRFRLRSKVALANEDGLQVYAVFGPGADIGRIDTRLPQAGRRAWLAAEPALPRGDWQAHRIALGLPDGSADLVPEKTLLLEAGFDELQGVDWQKGCFLGQEVTARSKYRGQIKKRLFPVAIEGPTPPPGTPILAGGQEVGEMRSHRGEIGLAMLRLDSVEKTLSAGEARLTAARPAWFNPDFSK